MTDAMKFMEKLVGPTTVGMLIRAYRTRNDLTQQDLAKTLGVTKSYVSNLENEHSTLSLKRTIEIAQKLGDSPQLFARIWIEDQLRDANIPAEVSITKFSMKKS